MLRKSDMVHYSWRKAVIGSIAEARRAGINAARPATPPSAMCFFAVHTPCHLFFRGHFQEAVQLFVQFLVGLSFSEQ